MNDGNEHKAEESHSLTDKREITNWWNCDGSCTVASFPFWVVRMYSFMHLILVTQNVRTRKKKIYVLCRSGSQNHRTA